MKPPNSHLRYLSFLFSLVCFAALCPAQQKATGYIQVTCEPGIKVFLNGTFKGITNADVGGLILEDVPAGIHKIRVFKEGFNPQEDTVQLVAGDVFEFKVRPFVPKLKITQAGKSEMTQVVRKVGSLKIQTLPIGCRITIPGLEIKGSSKTLDEWKVSEVPVRSYQATFSALGKETSHTFEIEQGRETHLFVNILSGKVEDRTVRPLLPSELDGKTITIPGLDLVLLPIPAGEFQMGSPASEEGRDDDEVRHKVTISKPFWIGKYEVTQAQWQAIMGSNPSYFKNAGSNAPVESVSWEDAMEFCRKVNSREKAAGRLPADYQYTLPTEAQWEYACRAGTDTTLYTGKLTILGSRNGPELDVIAWYGGNSGVDYNGGYDSSDWKEKQYNHNRAGTHPVGQKKPNAYGLYDTIGNVWEWCYDWYGDYPTDSVTDPAGPARGSNRVSRGGCWVLSARFCRAANRGGFTPGVRYLDLGFRLCLSPAIK